MAVHLLEELSDKITEMRELEDIEETKTTIRI